jgi:hypothetical protein
MNTKLTENDLTALEVLCEVAMIKGGMSYENPILERVRKIMDRQATEVLK